MNLPFSNPMMPASPKRMQDVGLPIVMMMQLMLKTMFRKNLERLQEISETICLSPMVTQELLEYAKSQRLVETTGTMGVAGETSAEVGYRLSDLGKSQALDALAQSEYYGAMPIPLDTYAEQVKKQSIRDVQVTRESLSQAMSHLILPPNLISELGPAVGSGRSILMYGPPGNGKSSISNGIRNSMNDLIYIPRALEYAGQVITVFDPILHSPVEDLMGDANALRKRATHDARYVRCQRPTVITGGELSLSMLDLIYDHKARTYQASMQLKATGGIFIIDDLGRQAEPPQSIVNRWIVPLEEQRDFLALNSGEKFEVPFDTLVIFSTNFHPNKIFDQAALRRIFYKIKIDGPTQKDFLKIFALIAKAKGLELDEKSLVRLLKVHFSTVDNIYANYQPGFLIDQMLSICEFEQLPKRMTPALVDRAWANLFVKDEEIVR
jgi:hypothetical protein